MRDQRQGRVQQSVNEKEQIIIMMRSFIMICFAAATFADKLGYNYQPVGHSDSGLSFTPGSSFISGSASSINGGSLGGRGLGNLGGVALESDIGNTAFGGNGDEHNLASNDAPFYSAPAELNKEFYTFSAPESEFDDGSAARKISSSVKQGLRIIFIKGPEHNGLENAALALAKHAAEQKTAIYVLNKQTNIEDLANKFNAIGQTNNNRPEVHFVKYRTPEDAANAQKAIQGQYDSLGGASQLHNGGVARVLNFASQASGQGAPVRALDNSYLPSALFLS